MKSPNLHIIWTEGKNLALPDLFTRTNNEEQFTKTRDITVEIPENNKFFFARTPFGNNIESQYIICYNNNVEKTDKHLLTLIITSLKSILTKINTNLYHMKNSKMKQNKPNTEIKTENKKREFIDN